MGESLLYVGLDVHAESITVAVAEPSRDGEIRLYGNIPSELHSLEKVLRKLGHPGKELHVCYKSGLRWIRQEILLEMPKPTAVIVPPIRPSGVTGWAYASNTHSICWPP